MKQVLFLFLLLFFITPIFSQTPLLGDINSDSSVDIVDALMLAQYYVGICDCVDDPVIADVNVDGAVNIVDALLIAQYYVGIITSLPPNAPPIENYTWILQSFGDRYNPVPPLAGTQITLRLNPAEQTALGDGGCNGYTGFYVIDGNNISIERIASTAMACMDPPGIMEQEMEYMRILAGAETYIVSQNNLTIYSSENRILIFR